MNLKKRECGNIKTGVIVQLYIIQLGNKNINKNAV